MPGYKGRYSTLYNILISCKRSGMIPGATQQYQPSPPFKTWRNNAFNLDKGVQEFNRCLMCYVGWMLWIARNEGLFHGKRSNPRHFASCLTSCQRISWSYKEHNRIRRVTTLRYRSTMNSIPQASKLVTLVPPSLLSREGQF